MWTEFLSLPSSPSSRRFRELLWFLYHRGELIKNKQHVVCVDIDDAVGPHDHYSLQPFIIIADATTSCRNSQNSCKIIDWMSFLFSGGGRLLGTHLAPSRREAVREWNTSEIASRL